MVILLGALIVYYPLKIVLSAWLPKYVDSLTYMALVFPMCVFEAKIALLINSYLKTLRKEKLNGDHKSDLTYYIPIKW